MHPRQQRRLAQSHVVLGQVHQRLRRATQHQSDPLPCLPTESFGGHPNAQSWELLPQRLTGTTLQRDEQWHLRQEQCRHA